jgi:phosphopantothenoylcysteine decarboxylase/phosphopantothenate--cysteine ligase
MTESITELRGKRLLLGVTGGIAAYKAASLARLLAKAGVDVRVAMTQAATRFVGTATFQALTGQPVWTDQWDTRVADGMAHISLTRDRDLMLVAPASADFMARVAQGLADDLLCTLALARSCPLMLAPAMNVEMWDNAATQRNLRLLRDDGVAIAGPAPGDQACGETGMGRLLEPEQLVEEVEAFFQPKRLTGRRVLVTAGPTQEAIDPVRVITNSSSGKMGYAVARAARESGAEVCLVSGPVSLATPIGVERIDVKSAREMFEAVKSNLTGCDVFVSVAAVSDYRLDQPHAQKIKKESAPNPHLELVANPDILGYVAGLKKGPLCVGFAAESEQLEANARKKRERKGVPLLAANLVQDALGKDDNAITLFDDRGVHPLGRGNKLDQARRLIAHVAAMLGPQKR